MSGRSCHPTSVSSDHEGDGILCRAMCVTSLRGALRYRFILDKHDGLIVLCSYLVSRGDFLPNFHLTCCTVVFLNITRTPARQRYQGHACSRCTLVAHWSRNPLSNLRRESCSADPYSSMKPRTFYRVVIVIAISRQTSRPSRPDQRGNGREECWS